MFMEIEQLYRTKKIYFQKLNRKTIFHILCLYSREITRDLVYKLKSKISVMWCGRWVWRRERARECMNRILGRFISNWISKIWFETEWVRHTLSEQRSLASNARAPIDYSSPPRRTGYTVRFDFFCCCCSFSFSCVMIVGMLLLLLLTLLCLLL